MNAQRVDYRSDRPSHLHRHGHCGDRPTRVAMLVKSAFAAALFASASVPAIASAQENNAKPATPAAISTSSNNSSTPRDLYAKAAAALVAKNILQATSDLQQLIDKYPRDELAPLAAMRLAECHASAAKWPECVAVLERWLPEVAASTQTIKLDPSAELRARSVLARGYLMTNQFAKVIELCDQETLPTGQSNGPSDAQRRALQQLQALATQARSRQEAGQAANLRSAAAAVREKRYTAAQADLAKVDATRLSADWNWRYYVLCAQCELGLGQPQAATKHLDAIELSTLKIAEQYAVRMIRFEAAMSSGTLAPADEELKALAALGGNDSQQSAMLALRRVELAMLRKDRQQVEQISRTAREKYPNFQSLHEFDLVLARNLLARVEFQEARQVLESVIQAAPANDPTAVPRAQWLMGESYFLSQDYARAIGHYSHVIDGNHAPLWTESALMQRGKCYEMTSQSQKAQADYQRLQADYPSSVLTADARSRMSELGNGATTSNLK